MNTELIVDISSIAKVKEFIRRTNEFNCDIDIICGRYVIDAKSIMGVFSINIIEPLTVKINSTDEEEIRRFNEGMEVFRIEDSI